MNKMKNVPNSLFFVCLIGLLVSSGCNNTSDRALFPNILIGKWKGNVQHTDGLGNRVEEVQIDIVDSEHLYYYSSFDLESDDGNALGFPLKIQFITDKQIFLQGRINDNWDIEIVGNSLLISNGILFGKQTVALTKVPRVERIFVFLGGFLMLLILGYLRPLKIKLPSLKGIDTDSKINKHGNLYMAIVDFTLHALIIVFAITIFIWGYVHITTSSYFYFLGMPWRAFLVLEVSLCLFVFGSKIRENNNRSIESPSFTPGAFNYYLSMILSIIGGLGITIGIVTWIIFMFTVWIDLGALYLY